MIQPAAMRLKVLARIPDTQAIRKLFAIFQIDKLLRSTGLLVTCSLSGGGTVWRVHYPTQKISKSVNGIMRQVTVVGGHQDFTTYEKANAYVQNLLQFWPGLVYEINPILARESTPVGVASRR